MSPIRTVECRGVVFGRGIPKICVPLVEKTMDALIGKARSIQGLPFDFVEWRADYFIGAEDAEQVKTVLHGLREVLDDKPLLFTFRTKAEGGVKDFMDSPYLALVHKVVEMGLVDLVDVEYRMGGEKIRNLVQVAKENGVKVITSFHDFNQTPSVNEIITILYSMQEYGADMTKVAVMPKEERDVLTLWEATLSMKERYADRPFITMSMGRKGILTRLSGEAFGSAVTFACVGKASAPGQIEVEELNSITSVLHKAMRGHILLIGFMGVGKTSVSKELSQRLGMPEKDTDADIVAEEGREISEIFSSEGESYFRDLETKRISRLKDEPASIISCGGGMVIRKENVVEMKKQGTVVCLTGTPRTIYERVKDDDKRPILTGNMNMEYIEELMDKRRGYYEAAADVTVATDGKTTKEIADEVVRLLGL